MNKKEYAQKLKDPRWQKKRLEIMSRDGFKCKKCWNDKSTLHVHHTYYENGVDPWDYPDVSLITLCDSCHSAEHEHEKSNISDDKEFLRKYKDPKMRAAVYKIVTGIKPEFALDFAEAFDLRLRDEENSDQYCMRRLNAARKFLQHAEWLIGQFDI